MYVDVNITPERTERLALWPGQSVQQVAADFAVVHSLNADMTNKLAAMLEQQRTAVLAAKAAKKRAQQQQLQQQQQQLMSS